MVAQINLDDDVIDEIKTRAIELDMVFNSVNDVLRVLLKMREKDTDTQNNNYPNSKIVEVQALLEGLKEAILNISKNGMVYHRKSRKWVSSPNTVTVTVQDKRSNNLRITVYGRPEEFKFLNPSLNIKNDMAGYSRFLVNNKSQIPSAIKVIKHSFALKKNRGRYI